MRRVRFRIRDAEALERHDPDANGATSPSRRKFYRSSFELNEERWLPLRRCPHGTWRHQGRWYFGLLWPDGGPALDFDLDADDACPRCLAEDLAAGTAVIVNPGEVVEVLDLEPDHDDAPPPEVAAMLRRLLAEVPG